MKRISITILIGFAFTLTCLAQHQTVNGNLTLTGKMFVHPATNVDNESPGIIAAANDDFRYRGKFLNHYGFGFYKGEPETSLRSYVSSFYGIEFFTEGKNRLTILGNGYIGIGTEYPQTRLDINGTIRSKEVKIEATGWSDFVFDKDYQLPTLQAVEDHIKDKGHLLDIPSKKEVLENGISVGEMQAKLLQKIEELTLYVIEQDKEIKSLKQELMKK